MPQRRQNVFSHDISSHRITHSLHHGKYLIVNCPLQYGRRAMLRRTPPRMFWSSTCGSRFTRIDWRHLWLELFTPYPTKARQQTKSQRSQITWEKARDDDLRMELAINIVDALFFSIVPPHTRHESHRFSMKISLEAPSAPRDTYEKQSHHSIIVFGRH